VVVGIAVTLLCAALIPAMVSAAFLYKSYLVKRDRGRDVLCDPYIVQKNDYLHKLFKQRGEISREDYPEFLSIFQRINPHVRDANLIRPGQQIFIPLRILQAGEMPGQSTGIVTVPFVTMGSVPEKLHSYSDIHVVQPGDTVSQLITRRFGRFGTRGYKEGIKLFRLMNPDVSDLNRITAGQQLRLPDPGLRKEPWYASLFDPREAGRIERPGTVPALVDPSNLTQAQGDDADKKIKSALEETADILEVKLLNKGMYYFPRLGRDDFKLDLTRYPALEFEDGTLSLLPNKGEIPASERADIESMPERLKLVPIALGAVTEEIVGSVLEATGRGSERNHLVFTDHNIRVEIRARWITRKNSPHNEYVGRLCITKLEDCGQRTPDSIVRYLEEHDIVIKEICRGGAAAIPSKTPTTRRGPLQIDAADRRSFVAAVLRALGCHYAPNVSITFPYAGMQVQAMTNLVTLSDGREFLVDFGDLYGDAISAIKETGFGILQISEQDKNLILAQILSAIGNPYEQGPSFLAAERPELYNIRLTIPGILVEPDSGQKVLFTGAALHHRIVQFLEDSDIRIVMTG